MKDNIIAFHGSEAFNLDKLGFDYNRIGTNIGTAFGPGIYFAKNRAYADAYRSRSKGSESTLRMFNNEGLDIFNIDTKDMFKDRASIADSYLNHLKSLNEHANLSFYAENNFLLSNPDILVDDFKEVAKSFRGLHIKKGDLYQAQLPGDNFLLDSDLTYSQQNKSIQEKLKKIPEFSDLIANDELGSKFSYNFFDDNQDPRLKDHFKLLRSNGILGHKMIMDVKTHTEDAFTIYHPDDIQNIESLYQKAPIISSSTLQDEKDFFNYLLNADEDIKYSTVATTPGADPVLTKLRDKGLIHVDDSGLIDWVGDLPKSYEDVFKEELTNKSPIHSDDYILKTLGKDTPLSSTFIPTSLMDKLEKVEDQSIKNNFKKALNAEQKSLTEIDKDITNILEEQVKAKANSNSKQNTSNQNLVNTTIDSPSEAVKQPTIQVSNTIGGGETAANNGGKGKAGVTSKPNSTSKAGSTKNTKSSQKNNSGTVSTNPPKGVKPSVVPNPVPSSIPNTPPAAAPIVTNVTPTSPVVPQTPSTVAPTTVNNVSQNITTVPPNNSISNFFENNKGSLKSFDVESTGLITTGKDLTKRSQIWQIGMYTEGLVGDNIHTNPFFTFRDDVAYIEKLKVKEAEERLRSSAGMFSEKAYQEGNFNQFLDDLKSNKVSTLDNALRTTFDSVNPSDVIVLQNMQFENRVLRSSKDMGILSEDVYNTIAEKMEYVGVDKEGKVLSLFQVPTTVQEKVRKASIIFNTEFLIGKRDETFSNYANMLNEAFDEYTNIITDKGRKGAVSVELRDITKTFLANAAERGLIDKETATLGQNLDFLSKAFYGKAEKHTAYEDAKLTTELFNEMTQMIKELREDKILSPRTIDVLKTIKQQQFNEVNNQFFSTVKSVLSDFEERGATNLPSNFSIHYPKATIKSSNGIEEISEISTGQAKRQTKDLDVAFQHIIDKYSQYTENINGVNREEYLNNILESKDSYKDMFRKVDKDHSEGLGKSEEVINGSVLNREKRELAPSTLKGTKGLTSNNKLAIAGLGLLAYMFASSGSKPEEKDYGNNVAENFYDDQYLGTAFVDFNNRNKHYMM